MADQQNTIKTTVELDATQAQQEIIKLNNKASDSTKSLTERVEAKNKQVELQEKLSKKTIDDLEKEVARIKKLEGGTGNYIRAQKKLNSAKIRATKLSESNAKQQSKLSGALKDSESASGKLSKATGGLSDKLKLLSTNPIILVVTLLAGAFKLVSEAIGRSEKASESFGKIGAKLSGLFNGLIAFITPVVELLGEALVFAIEKPGAAWDSFVDTIESGYNFIKKQVMDRLEGNWKVLSGTFEAGVLKMRIAWNNFTGDSEEAEQLTKELDKVIEKVREGTEQIKEANKAIVDVVVAAVEVVSETVEEAIKQADKAAKATEALANSERALARNRIALEKQQLKSLRLAEEERQIRDDTSKSIDERIAANQRLGAVLDEQLQRELKLAQQSLGFAQMQAAATGNTVANIEKIGDAEIKLLEIRERITGQRSEQLVNENALLKEQADLKAAEVEAAAKEEEERLAKEEEEKKKKEEERLAEQELKDRDIEAQFELDELEIERLAEQGTKVLDLELALLERKRKQDVSAEGLRAKEIEAINAKAKQAKDQLIEAEKKASKAKEDAVLDNALNGAAEAFGIAQEVSVARMIMEAPQAVAGSFKNAATSYSPPLSLVMGALGAAGTIVPIIKGLADIKKARFPKKSKKGGGSAGGGGTISTNIAAGAGGGSIGNSITPEVVSDIAANNSSRLGLDTDLGAGASSTASANVTGALSNRVVFSESRYREFQNQVAFKEDKTSIS